MRGQLSILLVLGVSIGCIETFEVSYDLDENPVVITGRITDAETAIVEITSTSPTPVTNRENVPRVSGATVTLVGSEGLREDLVEVRPGYFAGQTLGKVGELYNVEIILADGTEVRSTPQLLKGNPRIDSLYLENVSDYRSTGVSSQIDNRGLNLNLYMNRSDTVSKYYRWTMRGTYASFTAFNTPGRVCKTTVSDFDIQPCYITLEENSFFVVEESSRKDRDLFSLTLKFLRPSSQFANGQSIEVTQYSLTEEAYLYWKKIDDQAKSVGSIFDPPPSQIKGNLKQIGEETRDILGFFEASSVKKERIFIERSDFEVLEEDSPAFSDLGINAPCFEGWSDEFPPYDYCCDCSLYENSTRIKPAYWE